MSEQLFKFLAREISARFSQTALSLGERFHIRLETEEEVNQLHRPLIDLSDNTFVYKGCKLHELHLGGSPLVVIAESTTRTEGFLTHLRNEIVSPSTDQFRNKALLMLHYTPLDSITAGTGSLSREGGPLHHASLKLNLLKLVKDGDFHRNEKLLLKAWLASHAQQYTGNTSSILEFSPLVEVISASKLTPEIFNDLGYFSDPELTTIGTVREAQKRIEENRTKFEKVSLAHQFSANVKDDLDREFSQAGVDALANEDDWSNCTFGKVWQWAKDKEQKSPPAFVHPDHYFTPEEGLFYWHKVEGLSSAAKRRHHFVLFNPGQHESVCYELEFDREIRLGGIRAPSDPRLETSKRERRIVVTLTCGSEPIFACIRYRDPDSGQEQRFNIAVLPVDHAVLERLRTCFRVRTSTSKSVGALVLRTQDNIVINDNAASEEREQLVDDLTVQVAEDVRTVIELGSGFDEAETIPFTLDFGRGMVPCEVEQEASRPTAISGLRIWKLKRESRHTLDYVGGNRLRCGSDEFYVSNLISDYLSIEQEIVTKYKKDCFWKKTKSGLSPCDLLIPDGLRTAYAALVEGYDRRLPSLTKIDANLQLLMSTYVAEFLDSLNEAQDEEKLPAAVENLLKFCSIQHEDGEKRIEFPPLHPLNIAYQLQLLSEAGSTELTEPMLRSLSPHGLVPFLNSPFGNPSDKFCPIDELELREWLVYRIHDSLHQDTRNEYTERLVAEKLTEYVNHFGFLFTGSAYAPLRINLINLGDCIDPLQGIIAYFTKAIDRCNGDLDELLPIDVRIYGDAGSYNQFEQFSHHIDPEVIESGFGVSLKCKSIKDKGEVLRAIRDNLKVFINHGPYSTTEYAHITFYKFDDAKTQWTYHRSDAVDTGCSLGGLVSAVPSVFLAEEYKTGFGTKDLPIERSELISIAEQLNAISRVSYTADPYARGAATYAVIRAEEREELDEIYKTSNWVTFIQPKVDLNFFKQDTANDLIIIHYSDQYNNASGYDAITVTQKSRQYQALIHEYLVEKELSSTGEDEVALINMFNAINGDWLLRLIAGKQACTRGGAYFPKEKISILSAVKATMGVLAHPNIVWVPLSLEEVLRVSGGIGLKQSEGLFSKKNLGQRGQYCDDLLMAGLEDADGILLIHLLPIEVKIGRNASNVMTKAREQGLQTARLFRKFLTPPEPNFASKFYRSFFARLILIAAEKMELYGFGERDAWNRTVQLHRRQLLNDDFTVTWQLQECIGKFGVVSFRTDDFCRSLTLDDQGFTLELLNSDGHRNLTDAVATLAANYATPGTTIDEALLLVNSYAPAPAAATCPSTGPVLSAVDASDTQTVEPSVPPPQLDGGTPTANQSPPAGITILFGHEANAGKAVEWSPNDTDKVMHTNTGIIGTMGTGKTQFTKSLVTQLVRESTNNVNGTPLGILIFDYKGDYIKEKFVNATGAKCYDLYRLPYNPLALTVGSSPQPMLPLHTANAIKESIATAFGLGMVQRQKLRDVIMSAYQKHGIHKANPGAWSSPAPTLANVCEIYLNDEDAKRDSLYAAIDNLYQFEIFEPDSTKTQSLWDLVDGVTVINLSGYDQNIQNLIVAITLDLFYSQMQKAGHSTIGGNLRELRKVVLVDEADNFLSQNFDSIRKILKEGREFGVGTILSTQFLNHFSTSDNEYSNYILTWVVHRVSEITKKEVNSLFGANDKAQIDHLLSTITKLEKHTSVCSLGGAGPQLIRDRAFWELIN